jgi:hypothetical protein
MLSWLFDCSPNKWWETILKGYTLGILVAVFVGILLLIIGFPLETIVRTMAASSFAVGTIISAIMYIDGR